MKQIFYLTVFTALFLSSCADRPSQTDSYDFANDAVATWQALAQADDVDPVQLGWLRSTLTTAEAERLFGLVSALSKPDAAQLLASRFGVDPSYHGMANWDPMIDSLANVLSARPPRFAAGDVHVAYYVEQLRRYVISKMDGGVDPFDAPAPDFEPLTENNRLKVALNFETAHLLLDIFEGKVSPADDRVLEDRALTALTSHRAQSFYSMSVTEEVLTENLEHAASNRPIDNLYRYAYPNGLMHFADIRNRQASYRALVNTLSAHADAIAASISGKVGPYVPKGETVERTVHFLFASGADGWASGGVAAIDLEYFKADYPKLLRLLAHETVHAVQNALPSDESELTGADEAFSVALNTIFAEGTATHVAPPRVLSDSLYTAKVAEGTDLLGQIVDALYGGAEADIALARSLRNKGVAGAGPFYWLGAEMAKAMEADGGSEAIANAFYGDGVDYMLTYFGLELSDDWPKISAEIVAEVERLAVD